MAYLHRVKKINRLVQVIQNRKRIVPKNNIYKKNTLLLLGGANVNKSPTNKFTTKGTFVKYIEEISKGYDLVLWVASISDASLVKIKAPVKKSNIEIIAYKPKMPHSIILAWIRLIANVVKFRPDTLVFHSVLMLPVMPIIRLRSRSMIAYLGVDFEEAIKLKKIKNNSFWRWFYRKGFEYPLSHADYVFARGKKLKLLATNYNKNVEETLPLGWFNTKPKNQIKKQLNDLFRILYVGKLSEEKGIGILIKTINLLFAKYGADNFRVDLVGEGKNLSHFRGFKPELKEVIKEHGWIDDEFKIQKYFEAADILVCPSTYPEGVPRVIDEAIFYRLPVIATTVGGIDQEFSNAEIFKIRPNSVSELFSAIDLLIQNPTLRLKYIKNSKKRRESWLAQGTAAKQHKGKFTLIEKDSK